MINLWSHHNRWTFNMAIEKIQTDNIKNKLKLRNELVTAKSLQDKEWLLATPKVIRQQAVFRAVANWETASKNWKSGHTNKFKFQKKKENMWTLGIEKNLTISPNGEMSMFKGQPFNFGKFLCKDKIFKNFNLEADNNPFCLNAKGKLKLKCDSFIHKDKYNRYYLIAPYTVSKKTNVGEKIISLDPGLRKFLSAYSPDGECSFLGINCRDRLWSLLEKLDRLDTVLYAEKNPKRKRLLRKKKTAIYRKMNDLKDELHHKIISYLTREYSNIVIGKLNISDIVKKEGRFLRTKEVRSILGLSHYQFRMRLAQKSTETGVSLIQANESWTSKTCTHCGKIMRNLGGSEEFNCGKCGITIDRDINGARNILIKSMGVLDIQ